MNTPESQNIDNRVPHLRNASINAITGGEVQAMAALTPERYPLKDRREAILPLARHFIKLADEQLGTGQKKISKEGEEYLLSYEWPGDEKELELTVKKACILSESAVLLAEDLDLKHRQMKSVGKFVETRLKGFMQNIKRLEKFNLYDMVIPEVEKSLIIMVLRETGGNQIKAAKLLGINRNTLRSKIKALKIKLKDLK